MVGTLSIILDGPLGLPIDEFINIDGQRRQGQRIVELSALAVRNSTEFRGTKLYFPLANYVYRYSKRFLQADTVVCVLKNTAAPFMRHFWFQGN
ncbi:MAG: hypothetical protein R2827_05450 [Bdellovibrionales bacterium]